MATEPSTGAPASLIAPTVDEWRALTPAERERFLVRVRDALAADRAAQAAARAAYAADQAAQAVAQAAQATDQATQAAAQAAQAMAALQAGLLSLLAARGIPVPDEARSRVLACTDPATLQRWLLRAVTATSAAEALAPEESAGT